GIARDEAGLREPPRQVLVEVRSAEDVIDDEDRRGGRSLGPRDECGHSLAARQLDRDLLGPDVRQGRARGDLGMAHLHRPPGLLAPSGGVDRFVRVRDETLRAAESARHVEATIEVPEVLRGLDRLLERGFREPKRRRETLGTCLRGWEAASLLTGVSVVPTPGLDLHELAARARRVDAATHDHFILGIGAGGLRNPEWRKAHAMEDARPIPTMRDHLVT